MASFMGPMVIPGRSTSLGWVVVVRGARWGSNSQCSASLGHHGGLEFKSVEFWELELELGRVPCACSEWTVD